MLKESFNILRSRQFPDKRLQSYKRHTAYSNKIIISLHHGYHILQFRRIVEDFLPLYLAPISSYITEQDKWYLHLNGPLGFP